ncbi:MAG TPA: flavodoxin-dependent (E)-4-hydroxy-3-methylbut-2-enyl-diphosphate synthase [Candidatus Aminicenantes bacterium]|nr:flavodoxin-dependent (E)-4-hydroxy-3-methylbut-2-enyl-diphosphate synthase [Candidatus Aminicenantes bacterium]HRY66262.1 flavodoxin-dependent (E)-4-hydroxy-3-methylbut-2-enyl-diphosphate synthase [Candidatus Aminicenantes bacterium]HRZ73176.1 flavodoxin-dependent (E)-4-hydroxy-3-methylbut-2-enyl-diphosphate synthase [Candidatus Aminicenantes bacterium]
MFPRRTTRVIEVGGVAVGGGAPVVVQAMTKTDTRDVQATAAEVRRLERAGAEIVRLAVPDRAAAAALGEIRRRCGVPLVADIHFDHRLALAALDAGVDGLRLNPGNIGSPAKIREVVRAAAGRRVPIRIGVNSGSLEKDILARAGGATAAAMVESALRHVRLLEDLDFRLIKISLKASDVPRTLEAYRLLAARVDYPFHAGLTESGRLLAGSVKSSAGLALLLAEGLADTIRVSLTAPAEREVFVAWQILQALGLRKRGGVFVSCPTCGRCEVDLMRTAERVERAVLALSVPLTVAVMGCTVNGPGEAREADIGLACGRDGGVIFRGGKVLRKVPASRMADELIAEVGKLAASRRK